jgi:hypothetical protein
MAILPVYIAAWITHFVSCAMAGQWVFLAVGIISVPIGAIHGVWVWLSALF